MDSGSGGCASGITSPVDGSCVGSDQTNQTGDQSGLGLDQTGGQQGTGAGAIPNAGLSPAQINSQYPGLATAGINARIPTFTDLTGPNAAQAQTQALYAAQALALLNAAPPTEFQQMVRSSLGQMLSVYGDSLFRQVPSTFAPLEQVPVGPDYLIGPGDQLIVRIWGQINFNAKVTVDRSGSIYLPQIGEIHVVGLQYAQLQDHISDAVRRIYKNFNLSVELGELRSIQVFVVGQARRPGNYTLSSLSTLVTALFSTGGPSVHGSLRDIQLRRNGQTISHFDFYDLLIEGDKSKDAGLLTGDVIYIPPVGPQVAVGGSVRNPAIYELKGPTSVGQVLEFAGGLSATASLTQASLERIDDHKNRSVTDISLTGAGLETPLRQGDILDVPSISQEFHNAVTLRGNVAAPGRFAWHPGMRLSEIIPDSQSLITRDYWERRNQLGIPGPEFRPEYAVNPDFYNQNPAAAQNAALRNQILAASQAANQNAGGGNANANGYTGSGLNTGPTSNLNTATIAGGNQNAPNDFYDCDPSTNSTNATAQASAYSSGSQPGALPPCNIGANASPSSSTSNNAARPPLRVVLPVPEIDWSYAVIERFDPRTLATSLVPFNLGKLVQDHDPSQDLTLEAGDVVTIFSQADISVPQAQRTKFVRLEGEFNHAGIYSVRPGETLRDLVIRAGGITPDAYLFGTDFTRESARIIQQERLNDYLSHLEVEIDASTTAAAASSVNPQDQTATQAEVAAARNLVARFRLLRATGRIVLNIPPGASNVDTLPAIPLEDGDRLIIPARPSTVNVVGSVYNQNSFVYERRRAVGAYLMLAGGSTGDADGRHAFIIRADGSVVSRQSSIGIFGNTFESLPLDPGDTVVIPEKVPRPTILRDLVNYTAIFSNAAFGAAAIAILHP